MANKIKITFVLPITLQREIKERVIKDNYDLKGKSQWVSEAIEKLLVIYSFPDLVILNDEMKTFDKLESIVVSPRLKQQLNKAIIDVRIKHPSIEGVQSRIIRTAIVQRLLDL